jgi:hypothetical protein
MIQNLLKKEINIISLTNNIPRFSKKSQITQFAESKRSSAFSAFSTEEQTICCSSQAKKIKCQKYQDAELLTKGTYEGFQKSTNRNISASIINLN